MMFLVCVESRRRCNMMQLGVLLGFFFLLCLVFGCGTGQTWDEGRKSERSCNSFSKILSMLALFGDECTPGEKTIDSVVSKIISLVRSAADSKQSKEPPCRLSRSAACGANWMRRWGGTTKIVPLHKTKMLVKLRVLLRKVFRWIRISRNIITILCSRRVHPPYLPVAVQIAVEAVWMPIRNLHQVLPSIRVLVVLQKVWVC